MLAMKHVPLTVVTQKDPAALRVSLSRHKHHCSEQSHDTIAANSHTTHLQNCAACASSPGTLSAAAAKPEVTSTITHWWGDRSSA